ncbi:hypothetical protein OBV_31040 [Oscillibacter valericigenes Sjm18-20]|nr:hypothetical protein OBV_31040 [Oscillibacter valericigenes Sjm18-20]
MADYCAINKWISTSVLPCDFQRIDAHISINRIPKGYLWHTVFIGKYDMLYFPCFRMTGIWNSVFRSALCPIFRSKPFFLI